MFDRIAMSRYSRSMQKTGSKPMESPPSFEFSGIGTMMVCDVSGFSISEGMDVEEFARVANCHFASIIEIVHAQNGTIISSVGDATVAVWRSDTAPSHRETALACGRRILSLRKSEMASTLHIYIATGRMTLGWVANTFQAVGDPWIAVKKMEPFAAAGTSQIIVASQSTEPDPSIPDARLAGQIDIAGNNFPVQVIAA